MGICIRTKRRKIECIESHKKTLDILLEKLNITINELVQNPASPNHEIYLGAQKDLLHITDNLNLIEKDWLLLIDLVTEYSGALESNYSDDELMQLDLAARQKVIENENLFDELAFNKTIDNFVRSQEAVTNSLQNEYEQVLSNFLFSLYLIIPLTIFISIIISFAFTRTISKSITNLKNITNEITKGN